MSEYAQGNNRDRKDEHTVFNEYYSEQQVHLQASASQHAFVWQIRPQIHMIRLRRKGAACIFITLITKCTWADADTLTPNVADHLAVIAS